MRIFVLLAAFWLFLPGQALAEADYRPLIIKASLHWKVPAKLALAIARVESGLNPWAVNVAGRGYQPKTREEASAIIDQAWRRGVSFDVGLIKQGSPNFSVTSSAEIVSPLRSSMEFATLMPNVLR